MAHPFWRKTTRRRSPQWARSPIDSTIQDRAHQVATCRSGKVEPEPEPFHEYRDDPRGFCRDILGVEPWGKQVEIMESVRDHPRTSVAACFGCGKSYTAACLVLWWLLTRRPALVVTTAPSHRQVKKVLWRQVRKLFAKAKRRLPGRLTETGLTIADDWLAYGFSSDNPGNVAGQHEQNTLFIEDEASDIDPEVVEAWAGITTDENSRHLKIGNPVSTSGPFFETFMHPTEKLRWNRIHIDAEETPNVLAGREVVPSLVSHKWVEDKRHHWLLRGLTTLWETRVKGKFAVGASEKVIPADWLVKSWERWAIASCEGIRVLGVDIGAGGQDPTVVYLREGQRLRYIDSWQMENTYAQAERIVALAKELQVDRVVIDRTQVGQGVWCDVLQLQSVGDLPEDVHVVGVAMNVSAEDRDTFATRYAEVAFALREAVSPHNEDDWVALDPDDTLLAEEAQYRDWATDQKGLITVQSKRELRKLGKGSPDHCNAAELACLPVMQLNLQ